MITDLRDILAREKVKLHDLTIELCGDDINRDFITLTKEMWSNKL